MPVALSESICTRVEPSAPSARAIATMPPNEAPYPTLVSVGYTPGGEEWLLDLERRLQHRRDPRVAMCVDDEVAGCYATLTGRAVAWTTSNAVTNQRIRLQELEQRPCRPPTGSRASRL